MRLFEKICRCGTKRNKILFSKLHRMIGVRHGIHTIFYGEKLLIEASLHAPIQFLHASKNTDHTEQMQ